ncbi:MAG: hypothetical protein QOF73_1762 [Thermomicrobiales bacterium]|nr:hypothetical protein [Thermomicrobiales bacterium]
MHPKQSPSSRRADLTAIAAVFALLIGMTAASGIVRPPAAHAQAAMPATAALTPADAPIYVAVTIDPASRQLMLADALLRRLGLGDAVDEFWAGASEDLIGTAGFDEGNRLAGAELGIVVTDLAAATGDDSDGESAPGLVAILSLPAHAADVFTEEESALAQRAADADKTVERATYNGVTIVSVPEDQAIAQFGDVVVFADTPQDLYPVIDVHAGDAPALADEADVAKLRADLPTAAIAYAYVDGEALRAPLQQATIEDPTLAPFVASLAPKINHRFALALSADVGQVRLDLRLAPGTGMAAPADHPAPELALDQQVPADTLLFLNGIDLGESTGFETLILLIAQGVASLVSDQTGVVPLEPAQYFEAASRVLTFDLRDDFARQLVGEYGLAASATSLDVGGVDAVLVSGVDDPLPVADATSKLAVLLNAATFDNGAGTGPVPGAKEVDGGLIQVLDLPVDEDGTVLHLEFGVAGQRFLLGYRSGLSDFLAGPAETLAGNPRYQEAMAALPAERDWQLYLDLGRLIPLAQQADESLAADTASLDLSSVQSLAAAGFTRNGLRGMTMVLAVPAAYGAADGTPVASPAAS